MSKLQALRALGLRVNWQTVLVGFVGPGKVGQLLEPKDVISYAEDAIAGGDTSDEVVALAVSDDSQEIEKHLRMLSLREHSDAKQEERKWLLLLLKEALADLPPEPLSGLIALTSFWERFDYPEDSPHVVQGRGNKLSPSEYYTEVNFRDTVERHTRWIQRELAALLPLAAPPRSGA
jgi:hypothetical protein